MTVTVCQRIPPAGRRIDRQPAEAIRGRERQWQLLFLYRTFQWKKGAGRPACCLNLRQTSSSCLGHGTSQSHCHFVPQCCNVTVMYFSNESVYLVLHFSFNKHHETKFPLNYIIIANCYETSISLATCKMLSIGYYQSITRA